MDNVKQADIIVSPTGRIGRGGYANPGGFEDRQGHLVISLEDLADGKEIDAQLTIFHELCHYLFALPDEYRDGEQVGLCPLQNENGPRLPDGQLLVQRPPARLVRPVLQRRPQRPGPPARHRHLGSSRRSSRASN